MLRLSEWDDVYGQVVDRARELGMVAQGARASYTGVHRSLLAGFCTMVGVRGEEGCIPARAVCIFISSQARRWLDGGRDGSWPPASSRPRGYSRGASRKSSPMWIESAASHLVKREYLEPDWDEAREQVVARERISFLGLILSAGRLVNYGPIAPEESRLIFCARGFGVSAAAAAAGLAAGRTTPRCGGAADGGAAAHPRSGAVGRILRRILRSRLPRQVSSAATLEHFNRHLSPQQRAALTLTPEHIFARLPQDEALAQFPENTRVDALTVPVEYHFAPGEAQDGANLKVPAAGIAFSDARGD